MYKFLFLTVLGIYDESRYQSHKRVERSERGIARSETK